MAEKTGHILGADLPKLNPWQDDKLGYAPFAKRIAQVIVNLTAPNGYVIGIHGKWGSGKSTVLNFILEYLRKHNIENEGNQITHIDFRPWIVSGHQDQIVAFFKILSEKLGPKDISWKRFLKGAFRFVRGTTDNLVDAAATIALTIDPSGGTASRFAGNLAKKSVDSLLGRFLKDPSLQQAYENLKDQLGRSGKRFVVTIDDIDRLENRDVRTIMQLVKSIGQLPNVVYLLAYDRQIVWDALDQEGNRAGPRFAEKIVQQELELPKPARHTLLAILDREISFLTKSMDESTRWYDIVTNGIHRWIQLPRDVVRLSNAVKFSWPALEGEIDPQDLLAIEGLRLFDEGAFNWIRDNRDFFFSEGHFMMAQDEVRSGAVNILKQSASEIDRSQILRIISVLFPQSAKWFDGQKSFGGEAHVEVMKRRGVASKAGYDAYFGLHPSADEIPKAVLNDLMSRLDDIDYIETLIRSYFGKKNSRSEPMVNKFLDELRVQYMSNNPAQPTQQLLDALFRVGEDLLQIEWDGGILALSPRAQVGLLIKVMLEQWGYKKAGQCLVDAFEKCTSPAFLSDVYVDRGRELGVFKSNTSSQPLISEDDFRKLGVDLLQKIRAAVDDETLKNAPFYFDIERSWAHLDSPVIVKSWLSLGMMESAEFLFKAGRGLVSYSVGTTGRYYTMRDKPEPEIYDLQVLIDAGNKHLQQPNLTQDQRSLINEIVRGAGQLLKGRSSEGTKEDEA
jgi:energy-coupling factor transporter ATP-binding protein EcfA2